MFDIKIFTDRAEPDAVNQIYTLAALPPFSGARIRIMPDVHGGTGCVVGFTATLGDKIIPNVLGVDLGCGILTVELGKADFSFADLDAFIKTKIPSGSAVRSETGGRDIVGSLYCADGLRDLGRLYGSLGTLGGGNHFIEVDEDEERNRYLVIHSGSRNLGLQVAKIYQKKAVESCKFCAEEEKKAVAASLKSVGRQGDIPDALAKIAAKYAHKTKIPAEFCYLEGEEMERYLHDLRLCQKFASLNRRKIADDILKFLKIGKAPSFETVHNFIGEDGVIRKGAIPARKGMRVIIPMNMRDGCIIAAGKGNEDWNCSAPHGAGRICRRSEARERFTVEEYRAQMRGVFTTTATEATIDESPMAYKPPEEIVPLIAPTVEIEKIIKPVYNFKAGNG